MTPCGLLSHSSTPATSQPMCKRDSSVSRDAQGVMVLPLGKEQHARDLLSSEGELELWGRAAFRYLNEAIGSIPGTYSRTFGILVCCHQFESCIWFFYFWNKENENPSFINITFQKTTQKVKFPRNKSAGPVRWPLMRLRVY